MGDGSKYEHQQAEDQGQKTGEGGGKDYGQMRVWWVENEMGGGQG